MDRGKTQGSEVLEIRIAFADANGDVIAAWWEKLIFFDSILWKIEDFARSVNWEGLQPGVDVDLKPENTIGCRGVCEVEINRYTDRNGQTQENNRVAKWLAGKKLEVDLELRAKVLAEQSAESSSFPPANPSDELPSNDEIGDVGGTPF